MAQGRWRDAARDAFVLLRYEPSAVRRLVRRERISNRLVFTIGDPVHEAPRSTERPRGDLRLVRLGIERTDPGVGFNVQPTGLSALWLECENASPETLVIWDGVALDTSISSPTLVTASVPAELYCREGRAEIYLLH
jgi:hypothetical protein